jgi:hypothetical protein
MDRGVYLKDREQSLQDEIADLKQKMKDDKSKDDKSKDDKPKEEKPKKESPKKDKTPFDYKRVFKAAIPFLIIIVFVVGFFIGSVYQKNVLKDSKTEDKPSVAIPDTPSSGPKAVDKINTPEVINECSDTDDGFYPYTKAEVFFNSAIFYDSCSDNKTLTEYSCTDQNTVTSKTYACDLCVDGACVLFQNRTNTCSESDNYVDFNNKGYVKDSKGKVYVDSCSVNSLEEFYCDNFGAVGRKYTLCDKCQDGACIQAVQAPAGCTDTDGGLMYYTKGTVTEASGRTGTDNCQSRTLEEYYCSPREFMEKTYKLCNQCVDGACVNTTQ